MSELVCYCFRVEKSRIIAAIEEGCATVDCLSERTRACTGCGGCRPDLEDLLRFHAEESRSAPRGAAGGPSEPRALP
jgi:NAD(P)H-nitrite reductase large subunit